MNKKLFKIVVIVVVLGYVLISFLLGRWILAYQELLHQRQYDELEEFAESLIENPVKETTVEYVKPDLRFLGTYKITYYCACSECCGKSNGITATGTKATAGRTIAVDPAVIPYGTQILIAGHIYTAEDCGGAIKDKRIDIFCATHEEACRKGVDYLDVYMLIDPQVDNVGTGAIKFP